MLSSELQVKYINRKKAVDLYIDGLALKDISKITGISCSEIIRYVHKCMAFNTQQEQIGYAALIPNKQTIRSLGKLEKLFLKYPTLEPFVLGNYFNNKEYTLEHNMSIQTLHTKFVAECRRLGIQDYEYPFTLKDNGYYSLYTYIKKAETQRQEEAIRRQSLHAKHKFDTTGYGISYSMSSLHPYSIVQIDGHKIDMLYSVEVENEQGETVYMPATRAWVLAVMDVSTRAIIGYSISPYENYNQYDVLMAIHNAIVPHTKIQFTHTGLEYTENGGFPSTALPEMQWASFDMVMLDNAKSHLAKNTIEKLVNIAKCTVNFGSVATPETRGIIERFFKTLELNGFHRLPGTTGNGIADLKRNKPEHESVKYGITYSDICELLEYLIAQYNNSAHSSLENQTPLQVLERRVRQAGMLPYIIPQDERDSLEKFTYFTEERTLRGGYSSGSKPHISYLGVKYHAYDTQIPMNMIGQKVFIEVNPADVSHVQLYDNNGKYIAPLIAIGEWGRRPHSLKTHQAALMRKNRNKQNNNIFSPDLSIYENELRKNAKENRRDRTKASIMANEIEKEYNNPLPEKAMKRQHHKTNNMGTYTKEEMDIIDSISIEEAYQRGLI